MLMYENGVLFYRQSTEHRWREVPKDEHTKYWQERSKELELRCLAIVDEMKEVEEDLKLAKMLLHECAKDNLEKDSMIKFLESRINRGK